MLRLSPDTHGVLGLSLSNLGLFLASGLLLILILGGAYGSVWERTAELKATAHTLNSYLETLDAAYTDTRLLIQMPSVTSLQITCSTEYIMVSTKGAFGLPLAYTEVWRIRPWPRDNTSWRSGEDLHRWLNYTHGHTGSAEDPVNLTVLTALQQAQHADAARLAYTPLQINDAQPLFAEKVVVYTPENRAEFFLLYQPSLVNISA